MRLGGTMVKPVIRAITGPGAVGAWTAQPVPLPRDPAGRCGGWLGQPVSSRALRNQGDGAPDGPTSVMAQSEFGRRLTALAGTAYPQKITIESWSIPRSRSPISGDGRTSA